MPRSESNICPILNEHIEQQTTALELTMEDTMTHAQYHALMKLRRLVEVLDTGYPSLYSEADLVKILPDYRCHERYESRIIPTIRQAATTERTVRQLVRTLRVKWRFPIVSFTHKKGEATDPLAPSGGRCFGYRWASSKDDLQAYKDRIRPEIVEHMLAQMERYEVMDIIQLDLWGTHDTFFANAHLAVTELSGQNPDVSHAVDERDYELIQEELI